MKLFEAKQILKNAGYNLLSEGLFDDEEFAELCNDIQNRINNSYLNFEDVLEVLNNNGWDTETADDMVPVDESNVRGYVCAWTAVGNNAEGGDRCAKFYLIYNTDDDAVVVTDWEDAE